MTPTATLAPRRGTAADWEVESTEAIGAGGTLTIPPARRTEGSGPHWRVCPGDSDWITGSSALQAALEDCLSAVGGLERSA
ncbi:hypothetical protein M2283_008833 [Streptomyces pseudovenezuelae]|uniref:Uncharacterized protein n=1 Tax=Streptomyces pseudovenezuelae TaxID=67350 RepID=A0ABT6M0L2_9ACTN|nr:hypothetical protein [Streptomyces pseudovenezuelae]